LRLTISGRGFYRSNQGSGSTSCPQQWERVLNGPIRIPEAAKACSGNTMLSVLLPAIAGLPLG
jgi:hypothetical protein